MDKGKKGRTHGGEEGEGSAGKEEKCDCPCGEDLKAAAGQGAAAGPQEKVAPDYYGQLVQLKADFENYRKRMEKERPSLIAWGKSEIILKFLPICDLLLAAHQHVGRLQGGGGAGQMEEVVRGIEMIFKEFSKIFDQEGIRPMETVGRPYDPMATEILSVVEGDESNDGLVTEELQKGYYYGDKVLRPARVKIAKKKTPQQDQAPSEK